jgi:photosystem II stability/assembly factor-like uncharacterized protein
MKGRCSRRRLICGGVVVGAGLVAVAIAMLAMSGSPRANGWNCPSSRSWWGPADRGRSIDSLIVSSSVVSRIYVNDANLSLYVGDGERRFRWRRLARIPGDLEVSAGRRHDELFAAWGSVFKSIDGGRSWKTITCSKESMVNRVAVPASDPRTIYLAMDYTSNDHEPPGAGGMYRSSDGGRSWTRFTRYYPKPLPWPFNDLALQASDVVVGSRSSRVVYFATQYGGILMSRDGGANWYFNPIDRKAKVPIAPGGRYLIPTTIANGAGAHPALWIVTNASTVYRGDEYARHWSRMGNLRGISEVVADRRLANVVMAVSKKGAAMRTVDGGRHWAHVKGLPRNIQGVTIQPIDDTFYAWSLTTNVFRSRDHGATWTKLPPLPR